MKKTLIAFAVAAAFASAASAASFKAGTYTATAPGIHGDVTVEVTFTADKLADIKVTKQSETVGIGSKAVELLPGRMVAAQSPAVDGVTGATITTEAIRKAVSDCVKQAGVDPANLVPLAVKKTGGQKTLETDMVVVGGGGSGMSATIRGRMNGMNVILVEKMPYIGGAAAISGGQVVAQGSKLQKAFGSTEDSPESMIKDFMANGHNLNDPAKISLYANNVGATIDWLHEKVGVKFIPNDLPFLAEYSHRRALEFEGGAKTMAQHLREVIAGNGAQVLYSTRVEKLLQDKDGRVIGVEATDDNGVKYTIKSKATLLTTGGFGNNFNWKNFDLNVLVNFTIGRKMINNRMGLGFSRQSEDGHLTKLFDYRKLRPWDGVNKKPNAPAWGNSLSMNTDSAIEKVHHLALKQITLGYNLPDRISKKAGLSGVRFFLTAENLFYLSNYSGGNPEVVNIYTGRDNGDTYPLPRKYTLGLTLNF